MFKLPVVLLAPALLLLACGGDESGSPDPIVPEAPRACSDNWQEWTFEPTGGDPTGEWEIVLSCGEGVGKLSILPPCAVIDQAFVHSESESRGSFTLSGGQLSWLTIDSSRAWKSWPLECLGGTIRGCETTSGPYLNRLGAQIGWEECAVPAGSDECHCYLEVDEPYPYVSPCRVEGNTLSIGTNGYVADFAVDGDVLQWASKSEGYQDLMIARRRMKASTPAP